MKKTLILMICLLLGMAAPAFAQELSISGCAYVDANANALYDSGETLISGVPVTLESETGEPVQAVTDAYGQYAFEGLASGEYRLLSAVGDESLYAASIGSSREHENGSAMLPVTLGASSVQADIGLREGVQLMVTVYQDENANGEQGVYEEGVPNVLVEVLDGETVVASGTTYRKNGVTITVAPGTYVLRAVLPENYAFTVPGSQSCMASDGDMAVSDPITLSAEGENKAYIAIRPVGSFSGMAFEDANNNGVLDDGDTGVAGVTVYLKGERTGTQRQITTDETGLYHFLRLPGDKYTVTADLPEGMLYARYSSEGGDLRSIFTGENLQRVFSVKSGESTVSKNVGVIQRGAITGLAFLDLNYNGLYDEGEPGYAGVTMEVIKNSDSESVGKSSSAKDGTFRVENLRSSTYRLRAVLPDDGSIFTVAREDGVDQVNRFEQRSTRREYTVQPLVLDSGKELYALVGVARSATISGVAFEDADYNGRLNGKEKKISGLIVQALNESGEVVSEAVTDKNGAYTLKGIMPGSYIVQVQRKANHGFTRLRPNEKDGSHVTMLKGKFGVTDPITVAMGEEIRGINAGMLPSSTLSGSFFHDVNDNGLWDQDELGMMGAEVRLLSEDGEIDLYQSPAEDGSFFFDGVMPGSYTLSYLLPEHTEMARTAEGGNTVAHDGLITVTKPFTIEMGKEYQMPLAGAVTLGSFVGGVFNDTNANGLCDVDEAMLGGAVLTAISASGDEITAKADANGAFSLAGLRPGSYTLTVTLPDGYIFSHDLASDQIVLGSAGTQTFACPWQALVNRSEKAIGAVKPAKIGGVIWMDENKDGTRAGDEWIMENVPLILIDEATGLQAGETVSQENGFLFENVRPGDYTVQFALPEQSTPAKDSSSTFRHSGSAMVQSGITVAEGETVSTLTTGLVSATSIGGTAWLDENGRRRPVADVTVTLWQNGAYAAETVTDENGRYHFDGLWPDQYALSAAIPDGIIFVRPGDPSYEAGASVISNTEYGMSDGFQLSMAQHQLQKDILCIKSAKVGDVAWLDANQNGLQDGGERFMPGVTVRLIQNGAPVYETVTNEYGYYLFNDVYPGEYLLEASAYAELNPTAPVEGLRIISSCLVSGDGLTAHSESFRV
ncbi:MAG: hypothetical protein IKK75_15655, partial [Clostridia bacterium]|nr:hypothetical protein [Clostridia bacterium]